MRLTVTDTGSGMTPELQERIFEPFFTTKPVGQGTGLGLSTVLGLIRSHGGFIRVQSAVGRGTCFELFLPALPGGKAVSAPTPGAGLQRAHGEWILLVDDEESVREVARRALESQGYRVVPAAEGGEAFRLFQQHHEEIAAVVTDMMMPGMDGPLLVENLHRLRPEIPVVGITGMSERIGIQSIEKLPLAAFLYKPFTKERLLAVLHDVLHAS